VSKILEEPGDDCCNNENTEAEQKSLVSK